MPVALQKGEKVALTKEYPSLSKLQVGLGWDPLNKPFGFLGAILRGKADIDCDASVLMLENGRFLHKKDIIYFGNKLSSCGSIMHLGDNMTGVGSGDDETILIDLNRLPGRINQLIFVVNIYDCAEREQDFGMIRNAYIRIQDAETKEELLRFDLTEHEAGKTALILGELYKDDKGWNFTAIGEGTKERSLGEIALRYQ
ncbi:MAG: TerD family protein [Ectobacillus sp.]